MKRRNFTSKFKTRVVLEAIKESKTLAEIGQQHTLAPTQISKWKKEFLSNAESVFFEWGKATKKRDRNRTRHAFKNDWRIES